jgi:hypothetical protein
MRLAVTVLYKEDAVDPVYKASFPPPPPNNGVLEGGREGLGDFLV